MEMHQIRYFLAVERERNFSRAALACNITQPALTRAIQKLEGEIGGKLFNRQPGRIELTELGRAMHPRLEQAYRDLAEACTQAGEMLRSSRNRLRIGMMCTIGPSRLVGLIRTLHETLPDLDLSLTEAKGTAVLDALLADEIDIGLAGLPSYPDQVDVLPLFQERYAVAVPVGHRFANAHEVTLAELDGEAYIERTNCEFDAHFEASHGEWPIDVHTRYRSGREDWVQAMISAGLGLAILPESYPVIDGVAKCGLMTPVVARTISLVTLRDRTFSPTGIKLLQAIRAQAWD